MNKAYTSVLSVNVSHTNYKDALKIIQNTIEKKEKGYISVCAVHLVMECQGDKKLLEGVNKSLIVTPDGMPLVWLQKLYGYRKAERTYGPTLMLKACQTAEKNGYEVFFLGGNVGQGEEIVTKLKEIFPNLKVAGFAETPVRPIPKKENDKIVKEINKKKVKIVFVGMGCPRQEKWMIDNNGQVDANILIGVGAAFDFVCGRVRQAPAIMQNNGLEWLFRFFQEPRRLWHRYTVFNGKFIFSILKQIYSDKFMRHPKF